MSVIGLIGVKGSGKSTAAEILTKIFPNSISVAFADHLKETCSKTFDIPRDLFENREAKERLHAVKALTINEIFQITESFGAPLNEFLRHVGREYTSIRQLLQIVGTDMLRNYDELIHCKSLKFPENGYTIVTDVRFQNEAAYLENIGASLVYIENPDAELLINEDSHISEKEVLAFTRNYAGFSIKNDGKDMDQFRKDLLELSNKLRG